MSGYSEAIDTAARLMLLGGFERDEGRAAELQAGSTDALMTALRIRTGGAKVAELEVGQAVMHEVLTRARELVSEIDVEALIAARH